MVIAMVMVLAMTTTAGSPSEDDDACDFHLEVLPFRSLGGDDGDGDENNGDDDDDECVSNLPLEDLACVSSQALWKVCFSPVQILCSSGAQVQRHCVASNTTRYHEMVMMIMMM